MAADPQSLAIAAAAYGYALGGVGEPIGSIPITPLGDLGAAATLPMTANRVYVATLTAAACDLDFAVDAEPGAYWSRLLRLTQGPGGGKTVVWPARGIWTGSGFAPATASAAGACDEFVISSYDGGQTLYLKLVGSFPAVAP